MIPLHVSSIYDSWIPQVQDLYRRQLEALKSADAVVAISEDARRDAIQLGVESGRVHVVYPGVSPAFGQPVSTARLVEVRTKFGLPDRYFVFCSVLEEYKNWRRMLRVFGKARTLPLVMITSKTNHWYPVLLEEIRLLGLSDDEVLVTGHVSDEELQVIVGSAWATVVPSLYEGFGLPAAQSIEAGVPVVGSNRTSIPEVVQDAGILFEPEDDDAFLKAVGEMSDSTVREQTAELARQQKGRFSRERIAHELVSVYGSL
jgi:glycosyltransferase involved in cell wall biosynthesis